MYLFILIDDHSIYNLYISLHDYLTYFKEKLLKEKASSQLDDQIAAWDLWTLSSTETTMTSDDDY